MPAPVLRSSVLSSTAKDETAKDECPASFLLVRNHKERFPAGGNDTTCAIIYDAVYNAVYF